MKKIRKVILGIVSVILVAGFGFEMGSNMPDNVILLLDPKKRSYYSPVYVRDNMIEASSLVTIRNGDLKGKGYEPDPNCRDQGCFSSEDFSPIFVYKVKEMLGLNKSRWNPDGTWKW